MKKFSYFLFFLIITLNKSIGQTTGVPPYINYQGVARDVNGDPIPSQNIGLQFKISTSNNSGFYSETQPSVPTNSLGLFSTRIGLITPLPTNGWEYTPCQMQVFINVNNAGFTLLGTQALSSVPYALYSERSANGMPTGTVTGQTLFWDNTGPTPKWKVDNNLTNDGNHVGIGLLPANLENKLQVVSLDPNDSSVVFASHLNAKGREASFRGVSSGNTAANNSNPFNSAIYGAQFFGINKGSGMAVGSYAQALGDSLAIGILGIGTSTTSNGKAVGIFGSSPLLTGDNYAAIFDKGKVLINDSLFFGVAANPGTYGDVLTRSSTGRARWQTITTPTTSTSGPFTNSANYIHVAPTYSNNRIVFGIPYPAGGFPNLGRVTIVNPSTIGSDTTLIVLQKNSTKSAIYSESSGSGFAIEAKSPVTFLSSYAGYFDGGLIVKGKTNVSNAHALIIKDQPGANYLLAVRNDGKVGVGNLNPNENLQVETTGSTSLSIISGTTTQSNLFFGDGGFHFRGNIQYDNPSNTMSFWTNNTPNRIFIDNNGRVGLKTNSPGAYDLSIFSVTGNTALRLNNNLSASIGLVLGTSGSGSTLLSYENSPFDFGTNSATFMRAQPNGNVGIGSLSPSINSRLAIKDGHFQSQQTNAPGITGNNGTTATFWGPGGTDVTGIISIAMGATTAPGTQATVTFVKPYANTPIVIITPVNNNYAAEAVALNQVFVVASPTGFTIKFNSAYANPNFNMYFNYMVIEGN